MPGTLVQGSIFPAFLFAEEKETRFDEDVLQAIKPELRSKGRWHVVEERRLCLAMHAYDSSNITMWSSVSKSRVLSEELGTRWVETAP